MDLGMFIVANHWLIVGPADLLVLLILRLDRNETFFVLKICQRAIYIPSRFIPEGVAEV
jgi:hypothetical protein